ncbi:MAG TPA: efflux RND transporter periplasmic adaptor subunit [Methylotenera sp.]|nr:efflux RND transporter periplasmic adaptor subunit [Methylotenera sp.]HPH06086.1 efflux RND transporter periplasmic adaptor subunit [Methylotenera sp.]
MKSIIFIALTLFSQCVVAAEMIPMTVLQQKNLGVKVTKLQAARQVTGQAYPAEVVVPVNQVRVVSSAYAGLVDQLLVTAGQTVKQGQVLAHITSPELIIMQREYLQSSAQQRLAKQSLDRDATLFKEGIVAEKRLQASQNAHLESAAQHNERRQLLKLSGLSDSSINQLDKGGRFQNGITLTAPVAGVVLEQMVAQGQRIDATSPLLKIAQMHPLWVEIHVPLADIKRSNIQKGALISVKGLDATGTVIALLPSVKSQDQTAIVRAEVRQGADNLFPSQMVDAMIAPASTTLGNASFTVPTVALVNHQSRTVIFVQTSKGFEVREAKVLSTQGVTSTISSQLNGTEQVAFSGTAAIKASWQGMGGE